MDSGVYLAGIDLGTSMLKGVLTDDRGFIRAREKEAMRYLAQERGHVEFDAAGLYAQTAGMLRRLASALPPGGRIAALSFASASGNTLLTDGAGRPMIPAVSWMDKRVEDEMQTVFGDLPDVHETTGWPKLKQFPLAQLAWLKVHSKELLGQAAHICMSTDYVNYRLTGLWGIDRSTATTFYLQHQETGRWHAPYLDALEIPESKLPPICASGSVLGSITPAAAAETGLEAGTPVALGAFDHPCAAKASGILDEGSMLVSCGTSWVGLFPVRDRRKIIDRGMLCDPFLRPSGPWGAMCSLPAVSESIDRIVGKYISAGPGRYAEFDRLAASARPGAGGLRIDVTRPPEPPRLDRYAKEDVARALMEGVAARVRQWVDELAGSGIRIARAAMAGGPSESATWPRVLAAALGIPVTAPHGAFAGAAGAAMLAGTGIGIISKG